MNYRHIYMCIISNAKREMLLGARPKSQWYKKNFSNQYFEFHHILPRSLFPLWSKRKSNIVALTAREHFFCHQLLLKIYPNVNMYFAIVRMANKGTYRCSSRLYEKLRKELGNKKSLDALNRHFDGFNRDIDDTQFLQFKNTLKDSVPETNRVRDLPFSKRKTKGVWSLESREKLSKANKGNQRWLGKRHTDEYKEYMHQKMLGRNNYWTASSNVINKGNIIYCFEDDMFFESIRKAEAYYKSKNETFNRKWFNDLLNKSENDIVEYHNKHFKRIKEV